MSFFVYFAVVLFAAASALFGLDLMTAPLPPSKPGTQLAGTSAPTKLAMREAEQRAADRQTNNSDRALSPIYPASPGGAKPDVRMVYPPTNATTGAASAEDKSAPVQPPTNQAATAQAQAENNQRPAQLRAPATTTAKAEPAAATDTTGKAEPKDEPRAPAPSEANNTPVAQPVTQQTANRCNVQACAGAYRSFRASDCTYQPFSGPRRVCEAPPAMQRSAERARSRFTEYPRLERATRQTRRDAELRDVVRSVREMSTRDDREMSARNDDDGYDESVGGGRRVIIIQRNAGFWR